MGECECDCECDFECVCVCVSVSVSVSVGLGECKCECECVVHTLMCGCGGAVPRGADAVSKKSEGAAAVRDICGMRMRVRLRNDHWFGCGYGCG